MKLALIVMCFGIMSSIGTRAHADSKEFWITIGSDAVSKIDKRLKSSDALLGQKRNFSEKLDFHNGITVMKINESDLDIIGNVMHDEFHRCGGFVGHDSKEEALNWASQDSERENAKSLDFADYTINQGDLVRSFIVQAKAANVEATIRGLSNFNNRYYKSQTGVDSQQYLKNLWEQIVKNRSDAKVEYFKHSGWSQPSVVLTIEGSERPNETIVLGGHADSINGSFGDRTSAKAPGADDNASGIATLTEILRVYVESSYKPKHTIKFMAYAAEEVGLWGSKEIAQAAKRNNENVIGVLQLDMTNFKGSSNDITLMTDFTNTQQNAFFGKLIDEYVKVPWGQDRCGYACSDHASWNSQGYPASMPFEASMSNMNHRIHTAQDTIDISGGNANHALKFVHLGLAFATELDN